MHAYNINRTHHLKSYSLRQLFNPGHRMYRFTTLHTIHTYKYGPIRNMMNIFLLHLLGLVRVRLASLELLLDTYNEHDEHFSFLNVCIRIHYKGKYFGAFGIFLCTRSRYFYLIISLKTSPLSLFYFIYSIVFQTCEHVEFPFTS